MSRSLIFSIYLGFSIALMSCNAAALPDPSPNHKLSREDSLHLGNQIDSLNQWVTNRGVQEFDYKSEMLAYSSIENLKPFKLTPGNDPFNLLLQVPSYGQFQYVELVGYFFTDQTYYLILNCWDNNALHPLGYLLSVTPSFKMEAVPVYESTLDLTLDYSILKYSLLDDTRGQLVNFEENPGVIYDEQYDGVIRYDSSAVIQRLLPDLSKDEKRLASGCKFEVIVSCQNTVIGKLSDTAWVKVDRIKQTHCFPQSYENFVFISSRRWYNAYVDGSGEDWRIRLAPCK